MEARLRERELLGMAATRALPPRRYLAIAIAVVRLAVAAGAQNSPELPFAPGERMTYAGRVHVGVGGRGSIWVEGPIQLRGQSTWVLHSDMEGKLGPIRATIRNASWLDPAHMASLRYTSNERHLWKKVDDTVEIFPTEGHWTSRGGLDGSLGSDDPLDELSFLFFLRTLPLAPDTELTLSRHFDESRNPTLVHVVRREDIQVDAGRFHAIVVEMRVRDSRNYRGEGLIRIHLSDDRCRLLLRLESKLPDAGTATLALTSYEGTRTECTAKVP